MNKENIKNNDVYVVKKCWIDPLENRNAFGYSDYAVSFDEDIVKNFCNNQGFFTHNDCWAIALNEKIPKYKYITLKNIKEIM